MSRFFEETMQGLLEAVEIATVVIWATTGIWWPFAISMCGVVLASVWISAYYYKEIRYICPECGKVFKPSFKNVFFTYHTPTARKLKCPECGYKGMCVETARVE